MTASTRGKIGGTAAVLLFTASALLGLALLAAAVISDLEGATFDPAIRGGAAVKSLRCPVLLSTAESGTVTALVTNSLDRQVQYLVRVHVSEGFVTLFREINFSVPLAAGEKQTLQWEITADDAAYGMLVLVKVFQSGAYPLPARTGSCGVLVLPIPYLTGDQLFALALAGSLLGMGLGIALWKSAGRAAGIVRSDVGNAMSALAATLLLGTLVALTGSWIPSLLLLAFTVLLVLALVFYFLFKVQ